DSAAAYEAAFEPSDSRAAARRALRGTVGAALGALTDLAAGDTVLLPVFRAGVLFHRANETDFELRVTVGGLGNGVGVGDGDRSDSAAAYEAAFEPSDSRAAARRALRGTVGAALGALTDLAAGDTVLLPVFRAGVLFHRANETDFELRVTVGGLGNGVGVGDGD